jgi:hypothetical protein
MPPAVVVHVSNYAARKTNTRGEKKMHGFCLTLFTESQSTPRSKASQVRPSSVDGGEKQDPLLAARPRPGILPIALSTFALLSPPE